MIHVIPAHPAMAAMFEAQPVQTLAGQGMCEGAIALAIDSGPAFACVQDGRILAIGGIASLWGFGSRGILWGSLAAGIKQAMIPMHRAVLTALESTSHERIEAHILADHAEGCRWIEMLGFHRETPLPMKKFWQGRDFLMYAKVKG